MFKGRIAHGMLTASFISTVIGTKLPGPGCIYVSQNLKFLAPVRVGETVHPRRLDPRVDVERRRVAMETICNVGGKVVLTGEALLLVSRRPAWPPSSPKGASGDLPLSPNPADRAAAMRVQSLREPPADARGTALAIGNFDGVHLGHQAVIVRGGAPWRRDRWAPPAAWSPSSRIRASISTPGPAVPLTRFCAKPSCCVAWRRASVRAAVRPGVMRSSPEAFVAEALGRGCRRSSIVVGR